MRKSVIGLTAAAFISFAAPAVAQMSPDTSPPASPAPPASAFTVTGGATLISDYRFRGISQTDKRFAIQGTFTVAHQSGLYATVWASSIDDYIAAGGDAEVDLIVGAKRTFSGTTLDVGVLYYYYPGSSKLISNYKSDFIEPYIDIAHTFGPVTAKVTANYAPKQSGVGLGSQINAGPKEDSLYIAGDFTGGVPNTGFGLSAHLGHTFGPSYLSIGKEYTDWNVGVSYTWKAFSVGVTYVDTNKSLYTVSNPLAITDQSLRNISSAGVLGSVGVAF